MDRLSLNMEWCVPITPRLDITWDNISVMRISEQSFVPCYPHEEVTVLLGFKLEMP